MTAKTKSPDLEGMSAALFDALYVDQAPFHWIEFTPHGIVAGSLSLAALGHHFQR